MSVSVCAWQGGMHVPSLCVCALFAEGAKESELSEGVILVQTRITLCTCAEGAKEAKESELLLDPATESSSALPSAVTSIHAFTRHPRFCVRHTNHSFLLFGAFTPSHAAHAFVYVCVITLFLSLLCLVHLRLHTPPTPLTPLCT